MNKLIRAAVLLGLILLCTIVPVRASRAEAMLPEIEDGVAFFLQDAQLHEWNAIFEALPDEICQLWGDTSVYYVVEEYALGHILFSGNDLQNSMFALLKSALPSLLPLIASLLGVAIISGFLRAMSDAGIAGMQDIVGMVCQCFVVGIVMSNFLSLALLARECIVQTSTFIELAFPVLLTLLTAAGGIVSSGIFQPAMAMLSTGISTVLQTIVLPVILAGGILGILNNLTSRIQLGQLFQLSKTVAKWIIGLLFTLYFGITALQGLTAATFDGVSVRAAKFALDKFVPIVGGMVSGTVDTMLGCAMLVKNAVGMAAIGIAFSIVAAPLLRIAAGMLAFRVAAALCEPMGDPRIPQMLASLSEILSYLFAAVISLMIMFVITVGLLLSTGNLAMMGG